MRRKLIAGNWKMYGSKASIHSLISAISSCEVGNIDTVVFPPYVYLDCVSELLKGSSVAIGAQNMSPVLEGAYTGEVSAKMLREVGCYYVLVGHSERRTLFHETNNVIALKYQAAIHNDLIPILCVGETAAERAAGGTEKIVLEQIHAVLKLDSGEDLLKQGLIAYEPLWAIGTGKTATPEEAESVHSLIRSNLAEQNQTLAEKIRLIYGGSVRALQAEALLSMPNVDGVLVGGASLQANEFNEIRKFQHAVISLEH
jgi:triosephosphate isomerase (TIM)